MTYPANPQLECDIVMKGGITSGVIYPKAVCTLATTYRLRSVGGASAGAIAAAAAAAAELGRATGGFEQLERLPHDITTNSPGGGSVLFRLFQPTPEMYPLYRAFTAGMGKSHKVLRIIAALLTGFWFWALLGAALGVVVIVVCLLGSGPAQWAGIVAGALLLLIGLAVGVGVGVLRMLGGVPSAGFGLCTGMPGAGGKNAAALTPWLHERIQSMANRPGGAPLTFGDLLSARIELKTMTTNLTQRKPMAMPWRNQEYFFDPAEMRRLFPEDVVAWMENHPPNMGPDGNPLGTAAQRRRDLLRAQALPKRPFPPPEHVPVVVATRMSLSFPLLITAVPLYGVDYSRTANKEAADAGAQWLSANPDASPEEAAAAVTAKPTLEVNWFSDGGICANLPVHFFDSPLPTRPTFAVDLAGFPPDRQKSPDESENCYLPVANKAGLARRWTGLPSSGVGAIGTFISQIVDTARGWVDAAQLSMPGYRDRVVTIYHDDAEGGMNLAMPQPVVTSLANRGAAAAGLLVTKFAGQLPGKPPAWGWNNQRWIRFRTATAGLQGWLTAFQDKYETNVAGAPPYASLAGPGADGQLPSYRFGTSDRLFANDLTGALLGMASHWRSTDVMTTDPPSPRPQMKLVPDDGSASGAADGEAADTAAEAPTAGDDPSV